ncbi:hypothetical protein GRI42_02365 [Erythrobacter gaetbuli]|uniref:SHOCT domain-containing protein n=1 Tax=Qipengyuania gaetbuli TaxID=266952 RepID=A0A844XX43_9SPHN|nr:SHOCT domain-containing protein [Qipengyuania gaetbuli]MXO50146.1 hypothetical protein [Qipengyuania gaetbuli]
MTDKLTQLESLQRLKAMNALTDEEFENEKKRVLGQSEPTSPYEADDEGFSAGLAGWAKALAGIVAVGALALTGWLLYPRDVPAEEIEMVVTGTANLRNEPTTEGSEVVTKLSEGELVFGHWVEGSSDETARWLKIDYHGIDAYLWEGNLKPLEDEDLEVTDAAEGECPYIREAECREEAEANRLR